MVLRVKFFTDESDENDVLQGDGRHGRGNLWRQDAVRGEVVSRVNNRTTLVVLSSTNA